MTDSNVNKPVHNPYEKAYQMAMEKLTQLNPDDVAFNASARLDNGNLSLELINETFVISLQGKEILTQSGREVRMSEKILLLHYLVTADGAPLQRQEITLQEIPGAAFYYPTYQARTILPIARTFSKKIQVFIDAAQKIGFNLIEEKNMCRLKSLTLPNIPMTFIIWKPSDETTGASEQTIPNSETIKILYDAGITHYLPLEDIIILTELVCHRIAKTGLESEYLK